MGYSLTGSNPVHDVNLFSLFANRNVQLDNPQSDATTRSRALFHRLLHPLDITGAHVHGLLLVGPFGHPRKDNIG